jgi:pimeloyl-ACP methyl ester carboxylesterase
MMECDRSSDSPLSPRNGLRNLVFKPGFISPREEELLSSMFATHWGEQDYPGDAVKSPNWPFLAPGIWGPNNALSPKYAGDVNTLITATHKASVLWVRGAEDRAVSDAAASDPGTLGSVGLLPGWPGAEVYPPQPMLTQIRTVLDQYARSGVSYKEVVIENCGHTPYLEQPTEFNRAFHPHLTNKMS